MPPAPPVLPLPMPGTPPVPPVVGRRYVIGQLLGKGGMGEVWKAHDRHTGQDVALKRIRPARLRKGGVAAGETLRLTQEFRLLASLHHPNVIGVLDYGLDRQGWPFFTMRMLDGCETISVAAASRDRAAKARLLIQLFDGLAYLHRRGVLHRDLKQGNVLVVGDRLHIVDFGLSITTTEAGQVESLAGTLHYLAPELLDGALPSERSDLYAAGLLVYEVITGKYAFRSSSRNTLEEAIRRQQPDLDDPKLADGLDRLVKQLLAKNPQERPQDHGAVIAVLSGIAGASSDGGTPLPLDPPGEGVARAAPLVGRARELEALIQDLIAATDGNGRSRLVTGMVGAGKSRLVEELRSIALVRGALVVAGRCQAEVGMPFAPWRQVLRLLVIEQVITDQEAAVLKPLVPDIEQLLGRPVPSLPDIDPGGALARLTALIINLLRGLDRGVLVVIEDLHWAGYESIDLFTALAANAAELPVLLIGTARGEEAPNLPKSLGVDAVTDLKALDNDALEELAAGTIGPAGRSRALVELVARESEGNPFFAVEVLRAVVERAGGWDKVEAAPLPERLLIGGMRAVVSRRLHRLRPDDRNLVECAAIAGRDLDLALLAAVESQADWGSFLRRTAEQGLLEGRAGAWCFVHDQLRQTLVESIAPDRRRELHRRIAGVLAGRIGTDAAADLAHHWRQADEPGEEARWAARAGELALAAGAYRRAAGHLERVLELHRRYTRQFPAELDPLHILFHAGEAAFRAGDFPVALGHLQGVLAIADNPLPPGTARRVPGLLAQVAVQVIHRLPGGSWSCFPGGERRRLRRRLVARSWELLSRLHIYSGDGLAVLLCALRATNQSEILGRPLVFAHGILGCAAAAANRWRIANGYFSRCRALSEAAGDGVGLVDALVMESSAHLSAAHFEDAIERLRSARTTAGEIGYRLGQGQALTVEGVCHGYAGDLVRMLEVNREALECIRHHSHGHQPGFRCGQAMALTQLGRFTEARATLEQARLQAVPDDRLACSLVTAGLLLVHLREGDLAAAQVEERLLHDQLDGITTIPSPCAQLLEAPAELLIARWHLAIQHGDPVGDLPQQAELRWRTLARWARLNPIEVPFLWWFRGHQHFLRGLQSEAWAAWETGRTEAARLGMHLYEATLSLTLSKHGPRAQQRTNRTRARALALNSQAMWHVRQLETTAADEESGSAYQAWLSEEGTGTRTAAYNVATRRIEKG